MRLHLNLFGLLFFLVPSAALAAFCATPDPSCKSVFAMRGGGKIELYSSSDLRARNPQITTLVLLIHGLNRKFGPDFKDFAAVFSEPALAATTLVIAPHFPAEADRPGADFLYWKAHGWPSGEDSLDPTRTSSYEVLDELIVAISKAGMFPGLRKVLVTGMSAGGQVTQRYAAGGLAEAQLSGLHFRYLVASPSSYMYLDPSRKTSDAAFRFAQPTGVACAYNHYRYGLDSRNRYMSRKSAYQLAADFRARDVVLMVGAEDNATAVPNPPLEHDSKDGADLDVSCSAELQGASRLERAEVFKAYLDWLFPEKQHPLAIGAGVAHQRKLYAAPEARPWLVN